MTDLYSQFIKNASLQSPFYEEDDEFLAREEENNERIKEEQKKIEQEKKALLSELNQGVHKERNDQIKTFTLGGFALLLLL